MVSEVATPEDLLESAGADRYRMSTGFEVREMAKAFYADRPDDFDFLVIFTDYRVADIWQFAWVTRVDVAGVGLDTNHQRLYGEGLGADLTAEAGSAGRLQAVVFMNTPSLWSTSAYSAQDILTHEVGHRWLAHVQVPWADDPGVLEQWKDQPYEFPAGHWTILAGTGGPSAMGYGEVVDNGDGTITARSVIPMPYSRLDLYAMGLLPAAEVGPLFWVSGATGFAPPADALGQQWSAQSVLSAGAEVTFSGTAETFEVADLAAVFGPRDPPYGEAQDTFRFAFVLMCAPGSPCSPEGAAWVDGQRAAWEETFDWATGGRGAAETELDGQGDARD